MIRYNPIHLRLVVLILAGVIYSLAAAAQQVSYPDSWGRQGFQLTEQKSSGVEVTYSIRSFSFSREQINGKSKDMLTLPGNLLFNESDAPNLPGTGRFIAIPQGATATYEITASRTETFTGIEIAPAPRIPWESEDDPLEYHENTAIYGKDAFYPESPVMLGEVTQIRGVDVVTLGVTPFQYNPVTKELIVYRDLKVKVSFTGGTGHIGDDRLRSRWWDPLMKDMFLNGEMLPKVDYNMNQMAKETVGCDYLIITPTDDEFLQWADSIKLFRSQQGISTQVMTVEEAGGNDVNTLENFFDEIYYEWDIVPSAVLILGDYGSSSSNRIIAPVWDSYCASDNIWADVTGNDMPDYIFARMTAQDAGQLEVMVTKFLDYERTPPTSEGFYQNPITALGFQTVRWFQICSESVAGFWENELGKTPVRINAIYYGNPTTDPWSTATNTSAVLGVFGPNGLGYLPETPGDVNCTWNGDAQDVVNAINAGSFMLQHRDHGEWNQWGEPAFFNEDIDNLTNTELPFIWSVNCLTGKYNMSGECFAEKFHRYTYNGENSGALGLNAASETSYSFVNDAYAWGAYDNMWPEFMPDYGSTPEERGILPAFGMAAGKYFLEQSGWPYNIEAKVVTYHLFHHHGDAFNSVYSEVPAELSVFHMDYLYEGVTAFNVTANAGALIALTVNGEIIGTAEGTGAPVTILIPAQQPPDKMLVTVTLQNYYRYEQLIDIVPAEGPYIVHQAIELNDAAGNGNGIMETAESLLASITVENVGFENAENISVSLVSEDEYITITDSTEVYGNIPSGATWVVEDGFSWEVADNIPDLHAVLFEVHASDGTTTWTTYFVLYGHAPDLEIGSMIINEINGNGNGRLDAGEEAEIHLETTNSGSFMAANAQGILSAASAFVTIENPVYEFSALGASQTETAVFSITISEEAPIGAPVFFNYEVSSGAYAMSAGFSETIGLVGEDWESGDMQQYEWLTGGNGNWFVSTSDPFEGAYCVQSSDITDNGTAWLELEYEALNDGIISFAYKVSSESSYDFLRFYIDGALQDSWSGEKEWATAEYGVLEGVHTFKWAYEKDYSVSTGSDCAWVDFIVLPTPTVTTAYAGQDDAVCAGESYTLQGFATYYNQLNWSTSGTGTFDDDESLAAIYTPGAEDLEAGAVTLTLTAFSPDVEMSDDMLLSFPLAPVAFAGSDFQVCSGAPFALNEATAANQVSLMWTTAGDGSFNNPQVLNPVYLPGDGDMAAGSVVLVLTISGDAACSVASDEVEIGIYPEVTAFAGIDAEICSNGSYTMTEATAENYTSLLWSTSGDGSFEDETSLNTAYIPGQWDAANGFATISLLALAMEGCDDAASGFVLSVEQSPLVYAGEDNAVFPGDSYTLSDAVAIYFSERVWSTSGDGSFDDESGSNPTYTPGPDDIAGKEVTLTCTVYGGEFCDAVSDDMTLSVNTGLDENPAGFDIKVFPNPNDGTFMLELNGSRSENVSLRIFDALGNEVYTKEKMEINGSLVEYLTLDVDYGVYYIRIEGDNLLVNRKVVIGK